MQEELQYLIEIFDGRIQLYVYNLIDSCILRHCSKAMFAWTIAIKKSTWIELQLSSEWMNAKHSASWETVCGRLCLTGTTAKGQAGSKISQLC